ncbi:MAG: hypothetical protein HQ481_11695 [Alphaproteobacteria bacterium]|nr:hypothetical protein [Alphaproteobacteria bacterium]
MKTKTQNKPLSMLDPEIARAFSDTEQDIDELLLFVTKARLNFGFGSGHLAINHRNVLAPTSHNHSFIISMAASLAIENTAEQLGTVRFSLDGRNEAPKPRDLYSYGVLTERDPGSFSGRMALPRVMVQNLVVGIREKDTYQLKLFGYRRHAVVEKNGTLRSWDLIGFATAIDL